ncbi:MAG: hypothetical protein ACOX6H_03685 [Christensenellales bacterium]|jgi:hypothetical protein
MDIDKQIKSLYFYIKNEQVFVLRLIEDFGSSKLFIETQIKNAEKGKDLIVNVKEFENSEMKNLISAMYLVKSMRGCPDYTYDPATKIGFKPEGNSVTLTYGVEYDIAGMDSKKFNLSAIFFFTELNKIFDDENYLMALTHQYKTKVATYNELVEFEERQETLQRYNEHKKAIMQKSTKDGEEYIMAYIDLLVKSEQNTSLAIEHCKESFKVDFDATPGNEKEIYALPLEIKKLLVLSHIDLVLKHFSDEALTELKDQAYAIYPALLRIMKNLNIIDEKSYTLKGEFEPLNDVEIHKSENETEKVLN